VCKDIKFYLEGTVLKKKYFRLGSCFSLILAILVFAGSCKKTESTGPKQEDIASSGTSSQGQFGYWPGKNVPAGIQPGTVLNASYIGQDFPMHLPWQIASNKVLWAQIYDCLFFAYNGDPYDVRGSLAESWKFSDDKLSVVMQIRKGVVFSNGNQLTAQTIVDSFSVNAKLDPAAFASIKSMEASGEYELTFVFKANYPNFLPDFCDAIRGVVDPKAIEEFGTESNKAAIGSGPYRIDSYSSGERIVLKANQNYFLTERQPHIETVNLYVIPNEETAVSALISGDINFMKSQSTESAYAVRDSGKFQDVIYYPSPVMVYYYNMKKQPLFRNPAVREALAKLIDWQGICDLVFDGVNKPATSMWPEDTPLHVDDSKYYYYNPEEALQILQKAGIDPKTISFSILCNPNTVNVVTVIQGQLAQYGITVKPDQVAISAVRSMQARGEFEIGSSPSGYGKLNPASGLNESLNPNATSILYTFNAYDQKFFDQLVALYVEATTAPSYEEFINGCRNITDILQQNYVMLGGYRAVEFFFHADNVRNIVAVDVGGNPLFCYFYIGD
jgi:ABC-type transport system substrate-binding protein